MTKELETLEEMLETAEYIVKEQRIAKAQDKIVVTLGVPAQDKGTTNSIKISEIK